MHMAYIHHVCMSCDTIYQGQGAHAALRLWGRRLGGPVRVVRLRAAHAPAAQTTAVYKRARVQSERARYAHEKCSTRIRSCLSRCASCITPVRGGIEGNRHHCSAVMQTASPMPLMAAPLSQVHSRSTLDFFRLLMRLSYSCRSTASSGLSFAHCSSSLEYPTRPAKTPPTPTSLLYCQVCEACGRQRGAWEIAWSGLSRGSSRASASAYRVVVILLVVDVTVVIVVVVIVVVRWIPFAPCIALLLGLSTS
jgi:hypothetical protein